MFTEDLSVFLNVDEFADAATILDIQTASWERGDGGTWVRSDGDGWLLGSGASGTAINGIFDNEYIAAGDYGVESSTPAFLCRTADTSGVNHGDELLLNTVTYAVRGVQPDGTGMTLLILEVV